MNDSDIQLFADLGEDELAKVRAICEEHDYAQGDIILRQGQPTRSIHVILDGTARVTAIMADESEAPVRDEEVLVRLKPGDILGEMSFVDGTVPSLSVIAEQPSRHLELPHDKLRELLDSDAPLCRKFFTSLMRVLCQRLRETNRELVLSRYFIRGA